MAAPVFISYSSRDIGHARRMCDALEARGLGCWMAGRNVGPGQNFQEAIVRAIRSAGVMLLVFTENANSSNEIKKELALASRHELTVIPLRFQDIPPSEALAYELATRQWVDVFDDWDEKIEILSTTIALLAPSVATPILTSLTSLKSTTAESGERAASVPGAFSSQPAMLAVDTDLPARDSAAHAKKTVNEQVIPINDQAASSQAVPPVADDAFGGKLPLPLRIIAILMIAQSITWFGVIATRYLNEYPRSTYVPDYFYNFIGSYALVLPLEVIALSAGILLLRRSRIAILFGLGTSAVCLVFWIYTFGTTLRFLGTNSKPSAVMAFPATYIAIFAVAFTVLFRRRWIRLNAAQNQSGQ